MADTSYKTAADLLEDLVQLRDKIIASFQNSRERSLVITKIEEAEMWADRMGQPHDQG